MHDQEGEGEEDEEIIHSVKAKVYTLNKEEGSWKDLGLGMLKVKRHKETGARRLLLRNSSTGKVAIVSQFRRLRLYPHVGHSCLFQNFRLYSGMNPTVAKQVVSFMGHDDKGKGLPFRLRVKTEPAAQELKDVLEEGLP